MSDEVGRLQTVEMLSAEDDHPLVADLPLFSVCSASVVMPVVSSVLLISASLFMPRPYMFVTTRHVIDPGVSRVFAVETTLRSVADDSRHVSLSLEFSDLIVSAQNLTVQLSVYRRGAPAEPIAGAFRNRESTFRVFKSRFANATRFTARVTFPTVPSRRPIRSVWTLANGDALEFEWGVRAIVSLLTIPALTVIGTHLLKEGFSSLSLGQRVTAALVVVSFLYYNPVSAGRPFSGRAWVVASFFEFLAAGFVGLHSIIVFVAFIAAEDPQPFVGPPSGVFALSAAWSLVDRLSLPPIWLFPDEGIGARFSARVGLIASAYIVIFALYALAAAVSVRESMRRRFRYTFAVGTALLVSVVTYIVLGTAEIAVNTAAYQVAPPIVCFLYTALMFHGYQDTADAEIAAPAKIPDDTSIGADVNEANLGAGQPGV
jgi:hypothetical protein